MFDGGEGGLFGVRGFGLYERLTTWVTDLAEAQEGEASGDNVGYAGNLLGDPGADTLRVLARCRPLLQGSDPSCELMADESGPDAVRLTFYAPEIGFHEACCTAYLGPDSTQEAVFEHVAHTAAPIVEGRNGMVLCCGSRSSGKTYTMVGPPEKIRPQRGLSPSDGIIQRAVHLIFQQMEHMDAVFVVEVSFLEICPSEGGGRTEQLVDLLSDRPGPRLQVLQDPLNTGAFVCEGLTRPAVRNHEKVSELLQVGLEKQRQGKRPGHCIFTLRLESLAVEQGRAEPVVKQGKMVFVEFAGLPNPGLTRGSVGHGGQRCVALEMLLSDCVHGDSPVLLITNFSPELQRAPESVRTLSFAQRALLCRDEADSHGEAILPDSTGSGLLFKDEAAPALESLAGVLPQASPGGADDGGVPDPPDSARGEPQPTAEIAEIQKSSPPTQQATASDVMPAVIGPSEATVGMPTQAVVQQAGGHPATQPVPMPTQAAVQQAAGHPATQPVPMPTQAAVQQAAGHPATQPVPMPTQAAVQQASGHPATQPVPEMAPPTSLAGGAGDVHPDIVPLFAPASRADDADAVAQDQLQFKVRRDMTAAREAELLEALRECTASRRAVELDSEQMKVKLAGKEERVKLLMERTDELGQDRSRVHEEQRTLRTRADMQQQKLLMLEEELEKIRAQVSQTRAQVDEVMEQRVKMAEELRKGREAWCLKEAGLKEKAAKTRRELEDFKRKANVDQLRAGSRGSEELTLLRVRIKRLEEESQVKSEMLAEAQQKQANMELEQTLQTQREEALKQEGMRKLLQYKQELEAVNASENDLQKMLTELQDGLLAREDDILEDADAVIGA